MAGRRSTRKSSRNVEARRGRGYVDIGAAAGTALAFARRWVRVNADQTRPR